MEERTGKASQSTEERTQQASSTSEPVSQAGAEATEDVQRHAKEMADVERGIVARQLRSLSRAMDSAAGTLEADQQSRMSSYARWGSDELKHMAGELEQEDLQALVQRVRRIGEERPMLLLFGSGAAGFLAARVFSATTQQHTASQAGASQEQQEKHTTESGQPSPEGTTAQEETR